MESCILHESLENPTDLDSVWDFYRGYIIFKTSKASCFTWEYHMKLTDPVYLVFVDNVKMKMAICIGKESFRDVMSTKESKI